MIEHARTHIARTLTNDERERAYLLRLALSPAWDKHEHARRVADGLNTLRRLQAKWKRRATEKRMAALPARPVLTLESRRA